MCQPDSELLHDLWGEGISAVNAGYYELVCTDTQPTASVGCAWYVAVGQPDVQVGRGDVSSNVMLLDTDGDDYGAQYSRALIQNWLCSGRGNAHLNRPSSPITDFLFDPDDYFIKSHGFIR
jgi:hypothetical protein